MSDKFGRRFSMSIILAGVACGYLLLAQINASWPLYLAFSAVFICSLFVQAGCGAVFAVVPLIKRRMTGQIAGLAGAYGNVGALFFLTMNTFIDIQTFFWMLAGTALYALFWTLLVQKVNPFKPASVEEVLAREFAHEPGVDHGTYPDHTVAKAV